MICETCIYRNRDEYHKPCIVRRDDCKHYEKERGDMTDDLISRQAVLDLLFNSYIKTELTSIGYASKEYAELCVDELNELPSVNPQEPKTGHWIINTYPAHECVYCSNCKEEYYEDDLYLGGSEFPNYCPNCGARMVEPQESEE